MFDIVKKIYSLLNKQERKQFIYLVMMVIVVGLIEVAGIASVMPFMAVISKPQVVDTNRYLSSVYHALGFGSVNSFFVFLGLAVFAVILLSNFFKALVLWFELNFVHLQSYRLARRLLFNYLNQPYLFFLNQNTAVLGKNILQEVSKVAHEVVRPCTQIISRFVNVLFILALLVVVDPVLAVTIATILGSVYVILYFFLQGKIAWLGTQRFEATAQSFRAASEALGGIKVLKVLGRECFFWNHFSRNSYTVERNMVIRGVIGQLPSYIMEVLSFGGILIIVIYFLIRQDIQQSLPVLVLYAFAGYRLMPALQGIFSSITVLRFSKVALDVLHQDLSRTAGITSDWKPEKISPIPFRDQIKLSSITFTYPNACAPTIQELNLIIKKNTSIGLVGGSGAGKTTMVDILLGLLHPQHGFLMIDGVSVTSKNLLSWQRNVGYVPQDIFLSDDSLMGNIAFGVSPDEINVKDVERAARIANLHEFVINELPEGYATKIGERGVRLSGGQRQRIGIARALYNDPEVLIMDEATSALDGVTEDAVIQAIHNLSGKKTLIIIAHRLTTLKDCDVIYIMENGQIVERGTYVELSQSSHRFQAMAKTRTS